MSVLRMRDVTRSCYMLATKCVAPVLVLVALVAALWVMVWLMTNA
jgi:hypothetical protein